MKQLQNALTSNEQKVKDDIFIELYKKASKIKATKSLILLKHSLTKHINN